MRRDEKIICMPETLKSLLGWKGRHESKSSESSDCRDVWGLDYHVLGKPGLHGLLGRV